RPDRRRLARVRRVRGAAPRVGQRADRAALQVPGGCHPRHIEIGFGRRRGRSQAARAGRMKGRNMSTIVVGVDGSAEAGAALRWALDEAALKGANLAVVHAYSAPVPYEAFYAAGGHWPEMAEEARRAAEELVDEVL